MSPSRTIGRAALVVAIGILASRILGFARTMLINSLFGLTADNDLYQAAFTIPDWIFFMMAGGYLSITLVPLLAEKTDRRAEMQSIFSSIFVVVTGLMVVVIGVAMVAADPITDLFFPALDPTRLTGLTRIALGSQIFFVAGALLGAGQYAHHRFVVPSLAPVVYNLGIIAGGALGWARGNPSPEAFLWGGLGGAALGNFALQWWGVRRAGLRPLATIDLRNPAIRSYFVLAIPLMIGQSVVALDEQWPRWFGQLVGEGAIAGLAAARQLNMVPVGVIAQAAGVAAFPFLAGLFATGKTEELGSTVIRSVIGATRVAIPASAVLVVLAEPVVRVVYQRGAFDPAATDTVSSLLRIYALSIPLWAIHQVYTRAFYSRRQMWTPVTIGTAVTVFTLPGLWWAARNVGVGGIAAVSVISMAVYTATVALVWHHRLPGLTRVVRNLSMCSAVAGGGGWLAHLVTTRLDPGTGLSGSIIRILAGSAIVTAVYVALVPTEDGSLTRRWWSTRRDRV